MLGLSQGSPKGGLFCVKDSIARHTTALFNQDFIHRSTNAPLIWGCAVLLCCAVLPSLFRPADTNTCSRTARLASGIFLVRYQQLETSAPGLV